MKSKLLLMAVILIVLAIGVWVVARGHSEKVELLPAWLLTPQGMYSADSLVDPTMSWSPNSKSLVLTAKGNKTKSSWILRWRVGEKGLDRIVPGLSPNFTGEDTFMFFPPVGAMVIEHNLANRTDRGVLRDFHKVDFWKDITSFEYLPAKKTLALHFSDFTRYYEPGLEEVDLTGKPLGKLPRVTGGGVLDVTSSPDKQQVAEILGDLTGGTRALQVRPLKGTAGTKLIASGELGSVVWSPDGKTIAFADGNDVRVTDPAGNNIITVGRFAANSSTEQPPYVCRLQWSPDSKYLAAIQVIPTQEGGDMMAYVLDMTKLKM